MCKRKKGSNYNEKDSTWKDDSVFGVLLNYINDNEDTIDYLVCDDNGTEIADFIAMDSSNNKIYIHCKHDKTEKVHQHFKISADKQ